MLECSLRPFCEISWIGLRAILVFSILVSARNEGLRVRPFIVQHRDSNFGFKWLVLKIASDLTNCLLLVSSAGPWEKFVAKGAEKRLWLRYTLEDNVDEENSEFHPSLNDDWDRRERRLSISMDACCL